MNAFSAVYTISDSCPFSIQKIDTSHSPDTRTYLIRERDQYGEFPHIYAKICSANRPNAQHHDRSYGDWSCTHGRYSESSRQETCSVIVLSDTGCGTEVPNTSQPDNSNETCWYQPDVWNLRTFLESTINPAGEMPYLVMTTHCHYDHIMGIGKLPPTSIKASPADRPPTTVLTSSCVKSFVSPYDELQRHSLCGSVGLQAPHYDVGIWAEDMSRVVYTPMSMLSQRSPETSIPTPYTILHTPGHTPDSLAWYDADLRLLCVGDSFYVKETKTTRGAKWGSEPAMPVMFDLESDLTDWWGSLEKVLTFVRGKNKEVEDEDRTVEAGSFYCRCQRDRIETPVPGCVRELQEARGGTGKDAGDEEDDGFVLIDAVELPDDGNDAEASRAQTQQSFALPLRPSISLESNTTQVNRVSIPPPESVKQTGFDMLPPDQRRFIAMPTSPGPSHLTSPTSPSPKQVKPTLSSSSKPVITPSPPLRRDLHAAYPLYVQKKLNEEVEEAKKKQLRKEAERLARVRSNTDRDPWMLIVDGNKDKSLRALGSTKNNDGAVRSGQSSSRPHYSFACQATCQESLSPLAQPSLFNRSFDRCFRNQNMVPPLKHQLDSVKPRVRLCAAHTTLSLDAEHAILTMKAFMIRVLNDEVPCERVENGPRGEERWLWDDALALDGEGHGIELEQAGQSLGYYEATRKRQRDQKEEFFHGYSLLAPIVVMRRGRDLVKMIWGVPELVKAVKWRRPRGPAGVV